MPKMREFVQGGNEKGHPVQTAIDRDPVSLFPPNGRAVITKLTAPFFGNDEPKRLLIQ